MLVAGNTVLLVDDSPTQRRVFASHLREQGFYVLEAPSKTAALRELAAHPEISAVVTDHHMFNDGEEETTGYHLAIEIRKREILKKIPVSERIPIIHHSEGKLDTDKRISLERFRVLCIPKDMAKLPSLINQQIAIRQRSLSQEPVSVHVPSAEITGENVTQYPEARNVTVPSSQKIPVQDNPARSNSISSSEALEAAIARGLQGSNIRVEVVQDKEGHRGYRFEGKDEAIEALIAKLEPYKIKFENVCDEQGTVSVTAMPRFSVTKQNRSSSQQPNRQSDSTANIPSGKR